MAQQDLIISPHGAQLTNMAFMRGKCSALLELYPLGYFFDGFFPSLVRSTGAAAYYLYPAPSTPASCQEPPRKTQRMLLKPPLTFDPDVVATAAATIARQLARCLQNQKEKETGRAPY